MYEYEFFSDFINCYTIIMNFVKDILIAVNNISNNLGFRNIKITRKPLCDNKNLKKILSIKS